MHQNIRLVCVFLIHMFRGFITQGDALDLSNKWELSLNTYVLEFKF